MAKPIRALQKTPEPSSADGTSMTKIESWLLLRNSPTFGSYYNGKMSYTLHGKAWEKYVTDAFPDLREQITSENIYKSVIDLYAENMQPVPDELSGFSNVLVPLLSRGECVVVVDSAGTPHFPEHYEMISDGTYTVACIFTRDLENMLDSVTFAYSNGTTRLFQKDIPPDMAAATHEGYMYVEEKTGNSLFRFSLKDKGFGASLAALQDRVNHSVIDLTVVAEMYARPFWYLMNVELPPKNPYLPAGAQPEDKAMTEQKTDGASGRIFTTSSEGPFGQLDPPTITDMIAYHDSITDKVSSTTGIPQYYFKPGSGAPPTGVALKVLSKRFNNKIARMREDLEDVLVELCTLLGVEKTKEVQAKVKPGQTPKPKPGQAAKGPNPDLDAEKNEDDDAEPVEYEYEFWAQGDDLLQESLDAHGLSLSQMGYPLEYIAEVVTPGVNLDDYMDDALDAPVDKSVPGTPTPTSTAPTDMTAVGQKGLVATPGQVAAYGANPGQKAKA